MPRVCTICTHPEVTAIAQAIGVDESTVRADQKPAGNPAAAQEKPAPVVDPAQGHAGNPAPERQALTKYPELR